MAEYPSMPFDLDRAIPLWRNMTASEVGLSVELLTMLWGKPDHRMHAPIQWLRGIYAARRCTGSFGNDVEHVVRGTGAFWWYPRDEYLYSPYILEIVGRPQPRQPIPAWMKADAIAAAQRAAGGGGPDYTACDYCDDAVSADFHIDHLLPISRGGINHPDNLCVACPACNFAKGARTEREFRRHRAEIAGVAP